MIYRISTLVDITNTNARRGEDPIAYRQNQNYLSVLQTIGMRTNIEFISLEQENKSLTDMNFGSNFKGKQNVWTFTFEVEREGYLTVDNLVEDFDLVPFIPELEETAKFAKPVFHSKDLKHINIIFEVV
jgi:hypothetical protein